MLDLRIRSILDQDQVLRIAVTPFINNVTSDKKVLQNHFGWKYYNSLPKSIKIHKLPIHKGRLFPMLTPAWYSLNLMAESTIEPQNLLNEWSFSIWHPQSWGRCWCRRRCKMYGVLSCVNSTSSGLLWASGSKRILFCKGHTRRTRSHGSVIVQKSDAHTHSSSFPLRGPLK